jgi:hypothetical protein
VRPESDFTPPTELCPHPGRWHAHDGIATEVEVLELLAAMVRALQPDLVVETGTHHGWGAHAIGSALRANGHGRLTTLEVDPVAHAIARVRCAGLPVDCVLGDSLAYTPDRPVDLAWFDSETLIRADELTRFRPWMHARTVVGFHDTAPHHGWRWRLDGLGLVLLDLPTPRGVTFGRLEPDASAPVPA